MLRRLTVENYALIAKLEMELDENLNIITGETGAGKSILLGALGLLLGGKNEGQAIKESGERCTIEAQFDLTHLDLKGLFEQNDWEWEEELILRRVISPSGKSRAFVNDMPVQIAALKELGSRLIDIHSQHQNRILSDEMFRIEALDVIAGTQAEAESYRALFERLCALRSQLRALQRDEAEALRDREWMEFQHEELMAADLKENEDRELEQELAMLENAEEIGAALNGFVERMSADEVGVLSQLKSSASELSHIKKSYAAAEEYLERLQGVIAELKDMESSISFEAERLEADPERLEWAASRVSTLYSLEQKHRARDLDELIARRDEYAEKLSLINSGEERISNLSAELSKAEAAARKAAERLHKGRAGSKAMLEEGICATLSRLGMVGSRFVVELVPTSELTISGMERVEFRFSSVANRTPQPIEKIASGGELSRVMLAIKALLARNMELPTIIFDEIDTGVSGRIADAMGEIIAELAGSMQVIDITHLPQVASKGEAHFVVYKHEGKSNIRRLSSEERINEIANMLSGERITEAAREQAKILLRIF
ncbi:MAG: DNA repair protein RecN [Rikenellaceae bacterium]